MSQNVSTWLGEISEFWALETLFHSLFNPALEALLNKLRSSQHERQQRKEVQGKPKFLDTEIVSNSCFFAKIFIILFKNQWYESNENWHTYFGSLIAGCCFYPVSLWSQLPGPTTELATLEPPSARCSGRSKRNCSSCWDVHICSSFFFLRQYVLVFL